MAAVTKDIGLPFSAAHNVNPSKHYDEIRFYQRDEDNKDVLLQTITNTIKTVKFTNASIHLGEYSHI